MCVDVERLGEDVETYKLTRELARNWVCGELGGVINLDSADELVEALLRADALIAPPGKNKNGSWKTDKETLHPDQFRRPELASVLGYYNRLSTCLGTFMVPWLMQAEKWNGRISCQWNQTRSASDKGGGMRTGRIGTANHNLLNISKDFEGRDDGYKHPSFLEAFPSLPLCRSYILPDPGSVFLHRDFDGQELRLFAHFEQGDLLSKYIADPSIDVHGYIKEQVDRLVGRSIERTKIKNITFGRLYGAGLPRVQGLMRCGKAEAQQLITAHNGALPGRVMLNEEIVRLAKRGDKIRTWGGRLYGMPPSEDGDKSYVLLNYLVQGSAADYTKETLCDWYYNYRRVGQRLLTTVYDEINISAPAADAQFAMLDLRDCMNKDRCRTPMLSKGKMGPSWGELASCP